MSPLDQACTLLADLLKDGPRAAGEILAAAEGANISERTMQRAAEQMGVIKTKAGFDGGWNWALPAEGAKAEPATNRAAIIAARLRKLEAVKGRRAPIYAADPRLIRLVEAGITDADLREAYELATSFDDAPLTVGRLETYMREIIHASND
jgi:hypothetical protein